MRPITAPFCVRRPPVIRASGFQWIVLVPHPRVARRPTARCAVPVRYFTRGRFVTRRSVYTRACGSSRAEHHAPLLPPRESSGSTTPSRRSSVPSRRSSVPASAAGHSPLSGNRGNRGYLWCSGTANLHQSSVLVVTLLFNINNVSV